MTFGLVIILSIAISFLMSGMEAGVFALSRLRIRQQMRQGRRRAELLHGYLENSESFLWTIFIGNTISTFLAFSLILIWLYDWAGQHPALFWAIFALLAFLFYACCDLLPKMLFRLFPTRLCLLMAVPFRFIYIALSPLVSLVTAASNLFLRLTGGQSFTGHLFGSRSELRMLTRESHNLTSEERGMIERVLDLQNRTVGTVTVPLSKVISVHCNSMAQEIIDLCRQHHLTRLPVWKSEGASRRIVGIVSLKNLIYSHEFDPSQPVSTYLQPALYLREDLRLEEALRRMQRSGQRLAIVLALNQTESGIVSLQDILKAVFGEVTL